MAANNYFGIAHGGTQYRASPSIVLSAQPATGYPAAQAAYVQPTHQTAYATAAAGAPRPGAAYEAYPTAAAGQYAYTAAARPGATVTYDSKAYYAPTCAGVTPTVYTFADATTYQAAKPAYSTTSYTTPAAVRHAGNKPVVAPSQAASYTIYPGTNVAPNPAQAGVLNTTAGGSYSGYDAALYSAATTYYHQQQAAKAGGATWTLYKTKAAAGSTLNVGRHNRYNHKSKGAMQPQLHYCEVCKISCAGPQTYREHLEGQKHKKKDAAAKAGSTTTSSSARGSQNQLRCELCDVACTGTDAYAAHIRGAKHQKVLKLHTILGKPIPTADPVVNNSSTATSATADSATSPSSSKTAGGAVKVTDASKKGFVTTPKITFAAGNTNVKEEKNEDTKPKQVVIPEEDEKDVVPVGQEYIDEVKNEGGKVVSFNCKLCECKFNDPNAKEMHMKGRRHRLQYKKKVDPSLQVEVKPSIRLRKIQEDKLRRQAIKEEYYRRREAQDRWRDEMRMMMEEEAYFMGRGFGRGGMPFGPHGPMGFRRQDTNDDRHVMGKHAAIYPSEVELQAVQSMVSSCEKALKLVSDFVAESDGPPNGLSNDEDEAEVKIKIEKEDTDAKENSFQDKKDDGMPRALKGVMRVGVLAKGLLLHGDLNVQLVLLCSEKPTRTLLERVADCLPKQLAIVSEENKYEVKMCVEEAAVIVSTTADPSPVCSITLTSPIMRDENLLDGESVMVKDPPDVLDRQKCLAALAALRHAKWFQARANGLQSCVIVIRILRDLCQRVPTWTPLPEWAMELLVEKCISSGGTNMTPGDALRRVFECVASGILLPGGPGLYDPCEKDAHDAADELSAQEREDITASAQHALRLIAFRQIHKVLGMEPLPVPRFIHRKPLFNNPRKRRRDTTSSDVEGTEGGKKDKKEAGSPSTSK